MFARLAVVIASLAMLEGAAQAQVVLETQKFDSASAAAGAGWASLGATQNGNSFGFSATNYTNGASAAGEAGGTIARTTNLAYYADLSLGGLPGFNQLLHASGELMVGSYSFNNGIRIGFFDSSAVTGTISFIGFQVAEPLVAGQIRILPAIQVANGDNFEGPGDLTIANNTAYTWRSDWDPTLRRASVEFFDGNGASLGISTRTMSPAEVAPGGQLNAFGLFTGGIGQASSLNIADVFIDNLTYSFTPVPEPSSLCFCAIAALTAWRRLAPITKFSS